MIALGERDMYNNTITQIEQIFKAAGLEHVVNMVHIADHGPDETFAKLSAPLIITDGPWADLCKMDSKPEYDIPQKLGVELLKRAFDAHKLAQAASDEAWKIIKKNALNVETI